MNEISTVARSGEIATSVPGELAASPAVQQGVQMMELIRAAMSDRDFDADKLGKLLDVQERILDRQAEAEFNLAFSAMMPDLPRVMKNGAVLQKVNKNDPNSAMKKAYNYAKWEDIDKALRPVLIEHGFSLAFDSQQRVGDGGGLVVTGYLLHKAGHKKSAAIPVPIDTSGSKNNIQGIGSAFSYGKRYTATMLLNLVFEGEDDDAQTGGAAYVTNEQLGELQREAGSLGVDLEKFCAVFGVEALPKIERRDFERALNWMRVKKRAGQGAAT